jgi:hypothetical protein
MRTLVLCLSLCSAEYLGGDIPVDSEVPVVTSSIARSAGSILDSVFVGAYKDMVYVRAFIRVSVYTYL